jgi:putative ABC transport system permease protein
MINLRSVTEGVGIALGSLRASKVRAALTILGVAIGVMVVMVIGSMISGINNGVADIFAQLGPRTFFVFRHFEAGIHIDDDDRWWLRKPRLTPEEAERLQELPSIAHVVVDEWTGQSAVWESRSIARVGINGRGVAWPLASGGDIFPGRSFTNAEYLANARVVVLNQKLASELFGSLDPIGKTVRLGGVPFDVVGVYNPPPDIFGEGNDPRAIVPHTTFGKHLRVVTGGLTFLVIPAPEVAVLDAIDEVIGAMRSIRGLRPGDPNNFDVITQDKFLATWNQMTGLFFVVMLALSSVGLMVGGVGVVAVMMISVTERTREIGVRKALGAKRREILWQFLVEAATLTLVGGVFGMMLGAGITTLVKAATPLPAEVPILSVVAAIAMSIFTGIVFGLYPAARAARLDPVEALRYE